MIKSVYRIRTFIPFSKLQCSTFSSIRSKVLDDNFVRFQLIDVLHADRDLFIKSDRYQHVTPDIVSDTLNAAVNLAEKEYLPHSRKNDLCEPKWNPATGVDIIEDVGDAIAAYKGAGFFSAHADFEFGGMQLPSCVTSLLALPFTAANPGTTAYSFLTIAAGNMLRAVGTKKQLNKYLLPMLEGRYFGTMNLSETQAGSSLGDITTKVELRPDGTYSIKGSKMWISAGEHELSENIVHMVLAKVVHPSGGAQAGVKGISLFIVPKFRVTDDGTLGQKNGVSLAGLNHKMGYRGTTNCVMSYGEGEEECIGELLGGVGQGLATMFHMMNEARIAIGFGACGLGYAGYVRSLEYALERHQGRPASSKNPSSPQVPIIQHADVRRMLIAQKAYVEGALSLCMFGAFLVDQLNDPTLFSSENDREDATLLLDTLTPIIKSWPSEWCLEANKWAIQIFGGYGYTRDYDVEQIYRDNRLNMIHEGTNGIQSLDLLGRKVMAKEGRGIAVLLNAMRKSINHAKGVADSCSNTASGNLREHAVALEEAVDRLERTTSTLASAALKGNVELMLCNSHEYLNMTGHTAIAWRWLETEVAATLKTSNSKVEDGLPMDFYVGQRMASRYFFTHELPKTIHQARLLSSLDDLNLVLKNEYF